MAMKKKRKKGSELELEVKAKLANLSGIGDFIIQAMKELSVEQYASQVHLAVDEACTNIIEHAYSGKNGKSIRIHCTVTGNDIVIKIRDWGKSFDPDSIPPPDTESELFERKLGGLGIFLMKEIMDKVRYVSYPGRYNELIMIKRLPQTNRDT